MPGYESFAKQMLHLNMGLYVVPYGKNGHPNVKEYFKPENTICTLEDFDRHGNYDWRFGSGLVLPLSNIVMVDLDMHDPQRENGLLSWERICQRYDEEGAFPETWMYSTPRNGRHLLYRRPDDFPSDFSTGFFAPGAELKFNTATPLPANEKWKEIGKRKDGKSIYEKTGLRYQWMSNDAENPEDEVYYTPWKFPLAELPKWLTYWARYPKVPLLSDDEYKALTGHTPPFVRTKGASVYERFIEKHGREPVRAQELWDFHRIEIGALAILDGVRKDKERQERYRLTGSTRTTPEYSQAQVQEIIDDHSLTDRQPTYEGHLLKWRLPKCPLERDRADTRKDGHKQGSEGNVTISYDPETRTPMFYCFEGKCKELVEYEYDGNWWAALLASLGVEELPLFAPPPTIETITARKTKTTTKKKGKFDSRKDDRGFPIPDCQNGLMPPWDSHSEEERTARLAALDAHIEERYLQAKQRLCGHDPDMEVRKEKARKLLDPDIDPTTVFTLEKEWQKWHKECYLARHFPTCWFCDVPIDLLQEHLDRRFAIPAEEREAERKRIEGFFDYYQIQTTNSPFALSIYHFLHFKLSVESSTQSQPLQDICL
jgi:hypothetical protein